MTRRFFLQPSPPLAPHRREPWSPAPVLCLHQIPIPRLRLHCARSTTTSSLFTATSPQGRTSASEAPPITISETKRHRIFDRSPATFD
ncbi:hypothetical protein M0R45_026756 [Rubus argutus]|uniref:Uncharacterized protein n=1 Tax=Rubus argutus TaxID=59490 RepID=A0AAW1X0Y6_RUBAR